MVLLSPLSLFSLLLLFTSTTAFTTTTTAGEPLKLPLIHKPPFSTPSQALSSDSLRLSLLFSAHTSALQSPIISGASTGSGQYFASLTIGSPPQKLLLVADTGSDLLWVKCSACHNCSDHPLPPSSAFLARHSSTLSLTHCYEPACRLIPHPKSQPHCTHTRIHTPCRYEYSYADGSITSGFFSTETMTLNTSSGKPAKLRRLYFGCGFKTSGSGFNGAHGVMGLGRGSISFSSQLGRRFGNRFSYCLMDYTISPPPTSYLLIGGHQRAVAGKPNLSYTPLITNPLSPTFYYIGIKSVSVDGVKLPLSPSIWAVDEFGNGGTVIDSGTTLTFLPEQAYHEILTTVRKRVTLPKPNDPIPGFDLCFNVSGQEDPILPRLSFKLVGNSVFSPPARNYYIDTAEEVKCMAVQGVKMSAGFSVIGNLMQQGFVFEFDKDKSRLGFSRHDCALP